MALTRVDPRVLGPNAEVGSRSRELGTRQVPVGVGLTPPECPQEDELWKPERETFFILLQSPREYGVSEFDRLIDV